MKIHKPPKQSTTLKNVSHGSVVAIDEVDHEGRLYLVTDMDRYEVSDSPRDCVVLINLYDGCHECIGDWTNVRVLSSAELLPLGFDETRKRHGNA